MLVCTFKCAFHCGNQTIENTQMLSQNYFAGGVCVIHVVNNIHVYFYFTEPFTWTSAQMKT
jgi:hypothetical protein